MESEVEARALLVRELEVADELIDQIDLIDLALAACDTLSVPSPCAGLRELHSYQDVWRWVRDVVEDRLERDLSVTVRTQAQSGCAAVVRVGRLTHAFVSALAEDRRNGARDGWVDVSLPKGLGDGEVEIWRRRLEWLLGDWDALFVHRVGDMGQNSPLGWDLMSHAAIARRLQS